jgi:hypothetical protein
VHWAVRLQRLGWELGDIQAWLNRDRFARGKQPLDDEGGRSRHDDGRLWYRAASRYVKAGNRDIARRPKPLRALFEEIVPEIVPATTKSGPRFTPRQPTPKKKTPR